jgi:hypothetical protein
MRVSRVFGAGVAAVAVASTLPSARAEGLVCIGVSAQAIYRNYGYDHIVYLTNHCEGDAVCDVSTNVNPEPSHVSLSVNATVEVLTFRGSPARTFTPKVACRRAQ